MTRDAHSDEASGAEGMKLDPHWFHVFKSMVDNDLRTLGPYAFAVYCVIKSHCRLETGLAEPGIETIAKKAGISARQVMRELKTLQEHGYVRKVRVRKHNGYHLQERLSVFAPLGEKRAVVKLEYQPTKIQELVKAQRDAAHPAICGSHHSHREGAGYPVPEQHQHPRRGAGSATTVVPKQPDLTSQTHVAQGDHKSVSTRVAHVTDCHMPVSHGRWQFR